MGPRHYPRRPRGQRRTSVRAPGGVATDLRRSARNQVVAGAPPRLLNCGAKSCRPGTARGGPGGLLCPRQGTARWIEGEASDIDRISEMEAGNRKPRGPDPRSRAKVAPCRHDPGTSASRTYAYSTSMLLCRLTSRILNTDAPRRAALVRNRTFSTAWHTNGDCHLAVSRAGHSFAAGEEFTHGRHPGRFL
jgi:hypothetical protein